MKKILIVIISIVSIGIIFCANSKINASDDIGELLRSGFEKLDMGELDAAAKVFEKVLSLDDKNSSAYNGLGTIYTKKRDVNKAEQCFNKAISLDKNNPLGYLGLGFIRLGKGDLDPISYKENLDKAIELFKKANSLDDKLARPYVGLIKAYSSYKGKDYRAEILSNIQKLEKIDPKLAGHYYDILGLR